MDTNHIHQSKHRWQSKHRVRLYVEHMSSSVAVTKTERESFWDAGEKFKETDQYQWVEDNEIELQWHWNDNPSNWQRSVIFYADLSDAQYVNYSLRFFRDREEWK